MEPCHDREQLCFFVGALTTALTLDRVRRLIDYQAANTTRGTFFKTTARPYFDKL
jgi:hypothetical protein